MCRCERGWTIAPIHWFVIVVTASFRKDILYKQHSESKHKNSKRKSFDILYVADSVFSRVKPNYKLSDTVCRTGKFTTVSASENSIHFLSGLRNLYCAHYESNLKQSIAGGWTYLLRPYTVDDATE